MFEPTGVRRRTVLAGCGGVCAGALAGCTAYGPAEPVAPPAPAPAPPAVPAGQVTVLAVADVLVGGGVVLADRDALRSLPHRSLLWPSRTSRAMLVEPNVKFQSSVEGCHGPCDDEVVDPQPVAHLGWVAAAGLIGFAGNELVAVYRIRVGRRIGSAALVADGLHARGDGLTSLAVVAGAVGTAAGFPLADPLVGLAITAAILAMLKTASAQVWRRLMDGVDPHLIATAEQALVDQPGIIGVDRVRMRWVGHRLIADAAIRVPAQLSVGEGHELAHIARDALVAVVPRLLDATVHVAPAAPTRSAAASREANT